MTTLGVDSRTVKPADANETVGSRSTIVSTAVLGLPRLAPLTPDSARFTVKGPVAARSLRMRTLKVRDTWPGANVKVPDVAA